MSLGVVVPAMLLAAQTAIAGDESPPSAFPQPSETATPTPTTTATVTAPDEPAPVPATPVVPTSSPATSAPAASAPAVAAPLLDPALIDQQPASDIKPVGVAKYFDFGLGCRVLVASSGSAPACGMELQGGQGFVFSVGVGYFETPSTANRGGFYAEELFGGTIRASRRVFIPIGVGASAALFRKVGASAPEHGNPYYFGLGAVARVGVNWRFVRSWPYAIGLDYRAHLLPNRGFDDKSEPEASRPPIYVFAQSIGLSLMVRDEVVPK